MRTSNCKWLIWNAEKEDEIRNMEEPQVLKGNRGEIWAGRYEIETKIGEGGCAAVYRCRDLRLCRRAALKLAADQGQGAETIRQERICLQTMHHPMLPVLYDYGCEPREFLVMEYVDGVTLRQHIQHRGALPEREAVRGSLQLLECLTYIHELYPAYLYLDLKPDNVMIAQDGTWKLIDWGGAACMETDRGYPARVAGTEGYAAPEQRQGKGALLPATDLYAFGKTLYYMVTGADPACPPYGELPVQCYVPELGFYLERIIRKCLAENAEDRFRSAREVADALLRAEGGRREQGIRRRSHRFIRKVEKEIWLSEKKRECTF